MQQINQSQNRDRYERHPNKAVGDTAMVLQSGDRALDPPDHVDVCRFGGKHHGYRGQRALAVEAGASHACAGQEMSNGIQVVPRREFERKRAIVRGSGAENAPARLFVLRLAGEQIQRMRQDVDDRLQRIDCATGTAREVEDQGSSPYAANAAAESCQGILFRSCGAHLFRDALNELRADSACGLRRDIPIRDSGASGGDNQIHLIAEPDELFLDRWLIVRLRRRDSRPRIHAAAVPRPSPDPNGLRALRANRNH